MNPAVANDLIYQTNWLTLNIGGRWYGVSPSRLYSIDEGRYCQKDPIEAYVLMWRQQYGNMFGIYEATAFERKILSSRIPVAVNDYQYLPNQVTQSSDPLGDPITIIIDPSKDNSWADPRRLDDDITKVKSENRSKALEDKAYNDIKEKGKDSNFYDIRSPGGNVYTDRLRAHARLWNEKIDRLINYINISSKTWNEWLLNGEPSSKEKAISALMRIKIDRIVVVDRENAAKVLGQTLKTLKPGDYLVYETHTAAEVIDLGKNSMQPKEFGEILKKESEGGRKDINFVLGGCNLTQERVNIIAKHSGTPTAGSSGTTHTLIPADPKGELPPGKDKSELPKGAPYYNITIRDPFSSQGVQSK